MTQIINSEVKKYLQNDGLTQAILDHFNVKIKGDRPENIEILYPYYDGSKKVYSPFKGPGKDCRWIYKAGEKDIDSRIFGYSHVLAGGEIVLIVPQEKDVLNAFSLGIPAICIYTERGKIDPFHMRFLKTKFSKVVICLDNDTPGLILRKRIIKEFSIPSILIPEKYGKGLSDFIASGKTKEDIISLIMEENSGVNWDGTYYTAGEIQNLTDIDDPFIIPNILPGNNIIGIIGGSDSGKSLLCLQFSIGYILNRKFLGYQINGGKKVLFCSFEDSKYSLKKRMDKLKSELSIDEIDKIDHKLFFELSSTAYIEKIESHLLLHPDTGLIILDPFSEIMAGEDISSLGAVRGEMKKLYELCLNYNVTIVIIHHISKTAEESGRTGKLNSMGSQAFESKTRVLFELTKCKNTTNLQLAIVKGNDISPAFKHPTSSLTIELSHESLWFTTEVSKIKANTVKQPKPEIDWKQVFDSNQELSSGAINKILQKLYGMSEKSAEKIIHKELREYGSGKRGIYKNPTLSIDQVVAAEYDFDFQL